nr:F-box/FBD/LRR-repeat protein At1g13570-like [Ipomoea batatas]
MATRRGMEITQHEIRDYLISGLPIELKQRILECLPTRDAASVWLQHGQHGQLVFDQDFFQNIQNYVAENSTSAVNIINNILLLRGGPVKKFTLNINIKPMLQQSDVERWCSFLSRNGIEELTLHLFVLRKPSSLPRFTQKPDAGQTETRRAETSRPDAEFRQQFRLQCRGVFRFSGDYSTTTTGGAIDLTTTTTGGNNRSGVDDELQTATAVTPRVHATAIALPFAPDITPPRSCAARLHRLLRICSTAPLPVTLPPSSQGLMVLRGTGRWIFI